MNAYEQKQKKSVSASAVIRIVIWSVVLAILAGLFAAAMICADGWHFGRLSLSGGYTYDDPDSYFVGGGTSTETVTAVDISWINGDIDVLATDDDFVTIRDDYEGDNEDYRLRWKIENGRLTVKFRKSYWSFGMSNDVPVKKLTVLIPRDMLSAGGMKKVEIATVESAVTFEGSTGEMSFDSVDGKLTIRGHVGNLDVDSVDVRLDYTGSFGQADFDAVNITATMRLTAARSMDVDGVDNDITLYLSDSITGFAVESDGVDDHVIINGFDGLTSQKDWDYYWGDGSFTIDMDGVSPQLKIEKETND